MREIENNPEKTLLGMVLATPLVRAVDLQAIQHYRVNSLVLMENAASQCAQLISQLYPNRPSTVILCGSGNNGGDGVAISRKLRAAGWDCHCFVLGPLDKLTADNRANCEILLQGCDPTLKILDPNDWQAAIPRIQTAYLIVDALLGTGASGTLREPVASWIRAANSAEAARVAIDIPSGVNADTGQAQADHFQADHTLTFVALKPAMVRTESAGRFGKIHALPIGISEAQIQELIRDASKP